MLTGLFLRERWKELKIYEQVKQGAGRGNMIQVTRNIGGDSVVWHPLQPPISRRFEVMKFMKLMGPHHLFDAMHQVHFQNESYSHE